MKVVFLDSASLPVGLARPAWVTDWQDRPDTTPEQVVDAARNADAVITNKVRIGRAELEQLPNLKFICVAATGYDCIDLAACRDFAVTVCNVPAYSAQSVAESVIASIFALRRQLFAYQAAAVRDWPGSRHFCVHRAPTLTLCQKSGAPNFRRCPLTATLPPMFRTRQSATISSCWQRTSAAPNRFPPAA